MDEILARAGIFQGVEPSAVSALTKQLQPVDFPRGHTVFAEGEPGDRLFIIISGKVKIGRRSPDGRENLLTIMPPHTPNSTRLSSASAPHSRITGQCLQITAALRWAAPRTNNSSGSACRQRAWETQAIRASASAPWTNVLGSVVVPVLRATGRVVDTSVSP